MAIPQNHLYMSVEEYLAFESAAPVRHEYVDGQLFAMVGTTLRHNIISSNLQTILQTHLRGGSCRVFMSDVKVRVEATNSFYYPDIMVSCKPIDTSSTVITEPVLLAEILSPSTAATDKREKLVAYLKIQTLKEYLIVYQSKKRIEVYRKGLDGHWKIPEVVELQNTLEIQSLPKPLSIALDAIYEDVDWAEPNANAPWLVSETAYGSLELEEIY
ncbi:Uma2 family endonuclease [soil metagenome]